MKVITKDEFEQSTHFQILRKRLKGKNYLSTFILKNKQFVSRNKNKNYKLCYSIKLNNPSGNNQSSHKNGRSKSNTKRLTKLHATNNNQDHKQKEPTTQNFSYFALDLAPPLRVRHPAMTRTVFNLNTTATPLASYLAPPLGETDILLHAYTLYSTLYTVHCCYTLTWLRIWLRRSGTQTSCYDAEASCSTQPPRRRDDKSKGLIKIIYMTRRLPAQHNLLDR